MSASSAFHPPGDSPAAPPTSENATGHPESFRSAGSAEVAASGGVDPVAVEGVEWMSGSPLAAQTPREDMTGGPHSSTGSGWESSGWEPFISPDGATSGWGSDTVVDDDTLRLSDWGDAMITATAPAPSQPSQHSSDFTVYYDDPVEDGPEVIDGVARDGRLVVMSPLGPFTINLAARVPPPEELAREVPASPMNFFHFAVIVHGCAALRRNAGLEPVRCDFASPCRRCLKHPLANTRLAYRAIRSLEDVFEIYARYRAARDGQ